MSHKPRLSDLPPLCPDCSYNLRGISGYRCPECGNMFIPDEVRRHTEQLKYELGELGNVSKNVRFGTWLALAGIAFFMLTWLGGRYAGFTVIPVLGAVVGAVIGIVAFLLGMQVLRIMRLAPWLREYVADSPSSGHGLMVMLLGVTLFLMSLLM